MDVIAPVLDVLDDDLVGGVHGETAGGPLRPDVGDAPGVDYRGAAVLGAGRGEHEGVEQQGDRLVLVDVAVGLAVEHAFMHVLFCSKHE